jgi:hypothetical protein
MNCQYCNKIYSSKSSLNNHQKTAKFCVKLQNNIDTNTNFQCQYCEKVFTTKYNLSNHINICKKQKEDIKQKEDCKEQLQIQKEKYKQQLRKQKEEYKEDLLKQKEDYKEQLEKKDLQIKELQDKLERIANKAIEKPTTTNNLNTLNIASMIDFNNVDKVKDLIENKLNINHVVDGQKGLANFVKDNLLTDDTGKLLYVCTDPSRHIFKYKDSTGEVKKDVEAKKLTNYILEGGIRCKSSNIGNDWCKDDKGDINMNRFNIMLEQQQSIMKLSDDNNSFKKELASITS